VTFVAISAVHAKLCMNVYRTVKQQNGHFQQILLKCIKNDNTSFHQDNPISQCSEHHADLRASTLLLNEWPQNSTIQHPVDYHDWSAMLEMYHKLQLKPTKCNTTDELATSSICSNFSYLPSRHRHLITNKPT